MNNLVFLESEIKMPLMTLPVRSVSVKVQDKHILLSPGSKLNVEQLKELKNVTDIVAPNLFHLAGIPKANSIFQKAAVWGPPGAANKRSDINWQYTLSKQSWPYQNELKIIELKGMPKVNEFLFIHAASRTLIVSDFCFNLTNTNGFGAWLILSLFGTYKKLGVSRFFTNAIKNKQEFSHSIDELLQHDFDNIVVSHGQNVLGSGKDRLKQALFERGFEIKPTSK